MDMLPLHKGLHLIKNILISQNPPKWMRIIDIYIPIFADKFYSTENHFWHITFTCYKMEFSCGLSTPEWFVRAFCWQLIDISSIWCGVYINSGPFHCSFFPMIIRFLIVISRFNYVDRLIIDLFFLFLLFTISIYTSSNKIIFVIAYSDFWLGIYRKSLHAVNLLTLAHYFG